MQAPLKIPMSPRLLVQELAYLLEHTDDDPGDAHGTHESPYQMQKSVIITESIPEIA